MLVNVNSTAMANEATSILNPARALERAASTLAGQLNGCSGMAGIDPMAEEFALGSKEEGGYDASVNGQLRSALGVASMIESFGVTLGATAKAYRDMELVGADGGSNSISATSGGTIGQYCPSVGTALGNENLGTPGGEIMEFIENFLKDTAGIIIPTADTDAVGRAESAWNDYAGKLDGIKGQVEALIPSVSGMEFPQSEQVLAVQARLAQLVGDVAEDGRGMAGVCNSYASNVTLIRDELRSMLVQLAVEVALDIGIGIALSFVSFGAGALAGAAKAATTIARWIPRFASLINRLKTLVMAAKRTMAVLRRIAIEAIEGTVSGVAASTITGLSFGTFTWDNVGASAIGGSVGGVFSGPFSNIGTRITSRGVRVATTATVGGLTGAAGGVGGDFLASQVTNQEFNLLMSALVGGAGGTAGGGITNIRTPQLTPTTPTPSTPTPINVTGNGGSGTASPGNTNIPTPGGATGGATGGGGTTAPTINPDAPNVNPGGGGGGTTGGGGTGGPTNPGDAPTPPATLPSDGPTATPPQTDVTPPPADVTTPPADVTTPPPATPTTPPPADVTTPPADVDTPPADAGDGGDGSDGADSDAADGADTTDVDDAVVPPVDPAAPGTGSPDPSTNNLVTTTPPGSGSGATPPTGGPHRLPPWIQQDLTPRQQEIIAGQDPNGPGWYRHQETPGELHDLAQYPPMDNSTPPVPGKGEPGLDASGNVANPGDAATMLRSDPSEPFGHFDGKPLSLDDNRILYIDSHGNTNFPPNSGAVHGTRVVYTDMRAYLRDFGTLQIDRLGNPAGDFMGVGGGTLNDRGLPMWQTEAGVFSFVDLTGVQLPPGVGIEISLISDALGRDGGSLQLVFVDLTTGRPMPLSDPTLQPLFDLDTFGSHPTASDTIKGLETSQGW